MRVPPPVRGTEDSLTVISFEILPYSPTRKIESSFFTYLSIKGVLVHTPSRLTGRTSYDVSSVFEIGKVLRRTGGLLGGRPNRNDLTE